MEFEQPLYSLGQLRKRSLIPKILTLILLSIIFYLGILLNLYLLEMNAQQETLVKTLSLVLLLGIVALGVYFSYNKASKKILFYKNSVEFNNKKQKYAEITNIFPSKNLFDKMFHTYQIKLTKDFTIRNIPDSVQLKEYIEKLIEYNKI